MPCHVLSGTGGAGKTQLAAHHARTTWEAGGTDLLVWVTATDRAAILSAYAEAAAAVTGTDDTRHLGTDDPERAAARFLNWAQSTDRRWLIVLDDVADPADLSGLGGRLALWPPRTRGAGRWSPPAAATPPCPAIASTSACSPPPSPSPTSPRSSPRRTAGRSPKTSRRSPATSAGCRSPCPRRPPTWSTST
ncbi:NB-ARC domain-containing protein [Streptomyces netropsis]